ncbi:ribonuclease III [Patescibacteria group bacterium]|nr:ribonuclease III [Patescibacteria group bacterium]MBU1907151.1 ribonuclease III [Patescibacteria group bacterium]
MKLPEIDYTPLLKTLDLEFEDMSLLRMALTHRSFLNEYHGSEPIESYERLEYLGDSIVEFVVRDFLYENYPHMSEGDMTNAKARLVSNEYLGRIGLTLGLGELMLMSGGEDRRGGRADIHVNADAFEALIGAIYKTHGIGVVRLYIDHLVLRPIREMLQKDLRDPKSYLQEEMQRRANKTPHYTVVSESGPDHDPSFEVQVWVGRSYLATGVGSSIKQAQMDAARNAIREHFSEADQELIDG